MNIVIPKKYRSIAERLTALLPIATEQGFSIDDLSVVQDDTPNAYLEDARSGITTVIHLISPYHDNYMPNDNRYVHNNHYLLDYRTMELTDLPSMTQQDLSHFIFLGVNDGIRQLDIWRAGDTWAATSYSTMNPSMTTIEHHFSWFLMLLALDFPIEDALVLARAVLISAENRWPCQYESFPIPVLQHAELDIKLDWFSGQSNVHFPSLTEHSLGLYPVVDSVEWIERLLKLGVTTVQLRIKESSRDDLEQQIVKSIELGRQYQAQVFINDYWELAIKWGAFGVHLGQEDIEKANLEQLSEAKIRLGLSTHGYYELLRICQLSPSYIALGHIFPTTTKVMPSKPQGLVRLRLYQQLIDTIPNQVSIPTVAIGGIDTETAADVWKCGVSSLAVVRAVTQAKSPERVVDWFNQLMSVPFLDRNEQCEVSNDNR